MNPPGTQRSTPPKNSGGGTCVNKGGALDPGNRFKISVSDPSPLGGQRQAVFKALGPEEMFMANIRQVLFSFT